METESESAIQEGAKNSGPPAEPHQAKPSGKKTAFTNSTPHHKASTEGQAQAALAEEQRKAAAAQAAVEDLQRRLAAVEATLTEERRKAAEAQQALVERRATVEKPTEVAEQATGLAGEQATAFGLTPFVGLQGTDIFNVGQQMIEQAIK